MSTLIFAHILDLIISIAFSIFHSGQGNQGILGAPSKQQLDTVFGTHKDIDVMQILLEKGTAQAGDGISGGTGTFTNVSRGSAVIDSKGKGLTGI